jgi:hypothetical protein
MVKVALGLTMTAVVLSAWFPNLSFGSGSGDERYENVDKSFERDATKEVVVDTKKSKMYFDSKPSNRMHFYAAWDYCQNMNHGGHDDWRVASKDELRSLLELSRRSVTVKHAFKNVLEEKYWSSTEDYNGKSWYFDFDLGRYSTDRNSKMYRTICVRDSK